MTNCGTVIRSKAVPNSTGSLEEILSEYFSSLVFPAKPPHELKRSPVTGSQAPNLMSALRTPWHVYFAMLLKEGAPPDIQLKFEVILTTEPQRGDLLLLRRGDAGHRDGEAQVFRGMWPLLPQETLVEFKSLAWPLRKGDLARLQGYGAQYFAARLDEGPFALADLALVLILPKRGPMLAEELERMGWTMTPLGVGYARITGSGYALYLAIIEEVTEAEQDGLLGLFSRKQWTDKQIAWWWTHHAGSLEGMNVQDTENYNEIIAEMLASMSVEQRLLSLPDEALRSLSDEYLRSLPADLAAKIRARICTSSDH
jgi:hypothetical protein